MGLKDDPKIEYSNISAQSLRDTQTEKDLNLWNKPFPTDLLTIKGNKAYFKSTLNKTHTSLYNRKCALKVELTLSDGTVQLVDIGTFLMRGANIEDDTITLSLEDMAKPLIDTSAEKVKSGYHWYKNVTAKFLVEELVKQVYYDPRNGQVPRDFIIEGIRPTTLDGNPTLTSLGKPPTFTRITNTNINELKCRVLVKGDLGLGERLYLGLNESLYEYNEETSEYYKIGEVTTIGLNTIYIQKLWINNGMVYGIAHEDEKLTHTTENSEWPYELPIATDFILFKADRTSITILFDSQTSEGFAKMNQKLFTGQYHIVQPYFVGRQVSNSDYMQYFSMTMPYTTNNLFMYINSIGRFSADNRRAIPINTTQSIKFGDSENIALPFAQTVGIFLNRNIDKILPTKSTSFGYSFATAKSTINQNIEQKNPDWWRNIMLAPGYPLLFSDPKFNSLKVLGKVAIGLMDNVKDDVIDSLYPDKKYTILGNSEAYKKWICLLGTTNSGRWGINDSMLYDGTTPLAEYGHTNQRYVGMPYLSTIDKYFYPGYISIHDIEVSGKSVLEDFNFDWRNMSYTILKYTSGQSGSLEYLPNIGNQGSFFLSILDKDSTIDSTNGKNFRQHNICMNGVYNSGDANPYLLKFKYYLFDIETKSFTLLDLNLETSWLNKSGGSNVNVSDQITAVCQNGTDLWLATMTFQNVVESTNPTTFGNEKLNATAIYRVQLSNPAVPIITKIFDSKLSTSNHFRTITQMIYNNGTLVCSNYDRDKIITKEMIDRFPVINKPFYLSTHSATTVSHQFTDISFDNTPLNGTWQFRSLKLFNNNLYFVEAQDRTEIGGNSRLIKYDFNNQTFKELGLISGLVSGENNCLSNIECQTISNFDIVYLITAGYYSNPINKTINKNLLIKYDIALGGIIELADFSGMNIWDALTQLAYAFNYIVGFDNDSFFFIPKAINDEPDIFIDYDNDSVTKIKKTLEYDIKNVITATPYQTKMSDINWTIVNVPNEQAGPLDDWREQLSVSLRVRQDDELSKNIVLKVVSKGRVPADPNQFTSTDLSTNTVQYTSLRFAYLISSNVLTTKLFRALSGSETKVYLPSFFGDSTSNQLNIGDLLIIDYTNEDTQQATYLTRRIVNLNYDTNEITIDSPTLIDFEAYTPISIARANSIYDSDTDSIKIKNNSWSDEGVTFITSSTLIWSLGSYIIEVASIKRISIDNVFVVGNDTNQYRVLDTYFNNSTKKSYIRFAPLHDGYKPPNAFYKPEWLNQPIKAYWVPKGGSTTDSSLIEVGGSKVFVGFEPGSVGTFWLNNQGYDRIEITTDGLVLSSDSSSKYTAANLDSVKAYGELQNNIDDNKFVQHNLIEYHVRTLLAKQSNPKIILDVKSLIQAVNNAGDSYSIPFIKLVNASSRKLFNVRIRSKKLFPMFSNYSCDFYVTEHGISLKDFSQTLKLKSIQGY